jgi:hypothetical protein
MYNIYKNITENAFSILKKKLDKIEAISSPFMQQNNFYLNRSSFNDILALDYQQKESAFYGNIGLKYIDEPAVNSEHKFEFYVLKAMDKKDVRLYKRVILSQKYSLDQVDQSIYPYFEKCLSIYNEIAEKDLNEKIALKQ